MGIKRGPTNDLSSIQGIFLAMLRHGIERIFILSHMERLSSIRV